MLLCSHYPDKNQWYRISRRISLVK